MVKETPEGFFIVFVSYRTTTNCIREKYGWENSVTRDSFWTALFSSMFTKQFVIVRWNNFPLTMCYETEKNKRESIKPVVMYNLQGQHLAANKNIFFFFPAGCISGYWTILSEVGGYFHEALAAGQLKWLDIWKLRGCTQHCPHVNRRPECVLHTSLRVMLPMLSWDTLTNCTEKKS